MWANQLRWMVPVVKRTLTKTKPTRLLLVTKEKVNYYNIQLYSVVTNITSVQVSYQGWKESNKTIMSNFSLDLDETFG